MKELKKYAKIVYAADGMDVSETIELLTADDELAVQDKLKQLTQFADTAEFKVSYEYTFTELAPKPLI